VVLPAGRWMDQNTGELVDGDGVTAITVDAPLAVLPRWHRAGAIVPMFARYADTLLPATAGGVTSYTDPAFGGELRLTYVPAAALLEGGGISLHDGTTVIGSDFTVTITAGTEYSVFTLDIDGRDLGAPYDAVTAVSADGADLPNVADVTTCGPPGCFSFDGGTRRLQARVFGSSTITVR
jgi:hypothetical protein